MLSNHPTARVVLYVAALIAQIVSFFVAITSPELAAAFVATSTVLGGAAAGTALSNVSQPQSAQISAADASRSM